MGDIKIYEGNHKYGIPAYTVRDNKIYERDHTYGIPVYTIRDDKIYERDHTYGTSVYIIKIFDKNKQKPPKKIDKTSLDKNEHNKENREDSSGGGCLTWLVLLFIVGAIITNVFNIDLRDKDTKNNVKTESSKKTKKEFIFEDSDSRFLTDEEVSVLSKKKLRYAINEIYARRGRIFESEDLKKYFDKKSWYEPKYTKEVFDESVFNEFEIKNISLLSKYRDKKTK